MKKLILLTLLTACGTGEMTDQMKENALLETEKSEDIPDFSRWQIFPGSSDSCLQVSAEQMYCTSEFQADENCSDTTVKFISKRDGYMFVMTLTKLIVRQGEPHKLIFDGKPEVFNIQNNVVSQEYHAFQCYGSNGEIVKI